jgi:type IV secretory pathway VirB10-like protein
MTTPAGPATPAAPGTPAAPEAPDAPTPPAPPEAPVDKGFPEGTPLEQMTEPQRTAYWQHYARKHENAVKAYNGLTPQQVKDLQVKNEALETAQLSADDKALKTARDEAAKAAAATAKAEYLPQIQALQVKSIASQVIQGDKLNAFMAIVNPAALVGADGAVDETMVMGHLTAMYGDASVTPPPPGQRWQNAGQFSPPPPGAKPGEAGSAEAAKRFGAKKTT